MVCVAGVEGAGYALLLSDWTTHASSPSELEGTVGVRELMTGCASRPVPACSGFNTRMELYIGTRRLVIW